jgi:hypothetical protein
LSRIGAVGLKRRTRFLGIKPVMSAPEPQTYPRIARVKTPWATRFIIQPGINVDDGGLALGVFPLGGPL